ncbi:MAG: hypothetical protein MUC43_08750 [Pirellula sp.]|jgi:hypothetical protein|nr:hypothetical protein [Pirellula sp.]
METPSSIQFSDGPQMPEMREALLDTANVRELVSDLSQLTRILSVQCKTSARSQTPLNSSISLVQAAERLLSGEVQAVQVKYFFDHYEWTDTLMRLPNGVRMVRCRHEPDQPVHTH